jgi:hypothetical protein
MIVLSVIVLHFTFLWSCGSCPVFPLCILMFTILVPFYISSSFCCYSSHFIYMYITVNITLVFVLAFSKL